MLKIDMLSHADDVKGQGVGSVYDELMKMLHKYYSHQFHIEVNKYHRADITHYHTINFRFYLSTFLWNRGRKIGFVHFLPETLDESLKLPKPIKWIFYHYVIAFYKRMDKLVVVNSSFIPKLMAYGIPKQRITYIPNFVSKDTFYPMSAAKKVQLRKRLGFPIHKFTIIGTGQVQARKGVMDFAKLAEANPQYQFIWVGGFSFGRITDGYDELKQLVHHHPKNLSFPGIIPRQKMVNYYNLADLFLLPSYNELFPMSVLEAVSCGLPIVLRNLSLYQAILKGDYAEFNQFSDLNQIINNLAQDPELLRHYRIKAHQAAQYYSEERLAKIWYNFYLQQSKEVGKHDQA